MNERDKRFHSDRDILRKGDEITLTNKAGRKIDVVVVANYSGIIGAHEVASPSKRGLIDLNNWAVIS